MIAADNHFAWNTLTRSVRLVLIAMARPNIDLRSIAAANADALSRGKK